MEIRDSSRRKRNVLNIKANVFSQKCSRFFESDPERLLPTNTANRWRNASEQAKKRIICDYIAGMSDAYALKVYHQL